MERSRLIVAVSLFAGLVVVLAFLSVYFDRTDNVQATEKGKTYSQESADRVALNFSENDKNTLADEENARVVEFTGEEIERYEISEAGQYILKGRLKGNVHIDVIDETVHLILDGIDIRSDAGPAIFVRSADKVIITVSDGTENSLRDSTNYHDYKGAKACVFSEPDLTINGTGSLYIYGDYRGGVRSRGVLKLLNSNISVRGKSDGVRGNDGVFASSANLAVECEGSGIVSSNSKNGKGNVVFEGGSARIIAGKYGIESSNDIILTDCNTDISGVLSDYKYGNIANEGKEGTRGGN